MYNIRAFKCEICLFSSFWNIDIYRQYKQFLKFTERSTSSYVSVQLPSLLVQDQLDPHTLKEKP